MASYLLLRNNKESGPYSLEGLIQLGLKPYDLVWVEGRSAAWRYPSEVEDLKFYAPAVEEQPFDRFYKKPSELKADEEKKQLEIEQTFAKAKKTHAHPEVKIVSEIQKEVKSEIPEEVIEVKKPIEETEIKTPKKQVYVSMPANSGKTVFIKKTEQVAAANVNDAVNNLYNNSSNSYKEEPVKKPEPVIANAYSPSYSDLVSDYNKTQNNGKKNSSPTYEEPDNEYPLEKKYSQSLDDIKDMYVQTLVDRKRKTAQRKMMLNLTKKVLPFAAVLIIGILVGVFMNRNTNAVSQKQASDNNANAAQSLKTESAANGNNAAKADTQQTVLTTPASNVSTQQTIAEKNATDNAAGTAPEKSAIVQADNNGNNTAQQNTVALTAKKTTKKDNKTATQSDGNTALAQPKSIETDPATGERNKVVRASDAENGNAPITSTKQFSNALMKQVTVQSNEYKRGTFGGIHDLQLTVNNNSNYLLDNVLVELQLLKPNDQPLKTDNIRFSPVPPNGSLTLAIPATSRGVKVAYKIIHVESKSAANDTAGLK